MIASTNAMAKFARKYISAMVKYETWGRTSDKENLKATIVNKEISMILIELANSDYGSSSITTKTIIWSINSGK